VTLLNDLAVRNYREDSNGQPFTTRDAINEFRDIMLRKQPHERAVFLTKVVKDDAGGLVRKPDVELLLGETNVLGLEMESLRDVLYLKKSQKAGIKKGEENPYNLHPGEKILGNFYHDNNPYEVLIEVMEARTQNEVIRPIDFIKEEAGIRLDLIDYSIGGALIESSPEFLRFVLGDKVPANVDDDPDFAGEYWQEAFEELKKPMIHLTLYPKVYFPDAVKQFLPEMPFKIAIVCQNRSHPRGRVFGSNRPPTRSAIRLRRPGNSVKGRRPCRLALLPLHQGQQIPQGRSQPSDPTLRLSGKPKYDLRQLGGTRGQLSNRAPAILAALVFSLFRRP
jgi:hypothetical protein